MSVAGKIFEFTDARNNQELPISLSEKEKSLLADIRVGKFNTIVIKLKSGEIERLEKTENLGAVKESFEMTREIIKARGYQRIVLETEYGRTIKLERTIKEK